MFILSELMSKYQGQDCPYLVQNQPVRTHTVLNHLGSLGEYPSMRNESRQSAFVMPIRFLLAKPKCIDKRIGT